MIELVGTLVEVRASRDSWAAGSLNVDAHEAPEDLRGATLSVSGRRLGHAQLGEALRVQGELAHHPRYGPELKIEQLERLGVRTKDSAHLWLDQLAGVGLARARRIAKHFDGELIEVLGTPPAEGERDRLLEVESIGPVVVEKIRESWAKLCERADPAQIQYLASLRLTEAERDAVLDLAKQRGVTAQELLAKDPYALGTLHGWGFVRTDGVAIAAGVARESPARLEAALVHFLRELVDGAGHTVVGRKHLLAIGCERLGLEAGKLGEALDRLEAAGGIATSKHEGEQLVHLPELLAAEQLIWNFMQENTEAF